MLYYLGLFFLILIRGITQRKFKKYPLKFRGFFTNVKHNHHDGTQIDMIFCICFRSKNN